MREYKNECFVLLFLLNSIFCIGQTYVDTISASNFEELFELFNNEFESDKREEILNFYIKKAKKEENVEELMSGYQLKGIMNENENALVYSDSIIELSRPIDSHFNTSSAYQRKGEFYYDKRNFVKALDNFIKAKEYAIKDGSKHLIFYNSLSIGIIKDLIGEHEDALKIHKENFELGEKYIKNNDNDTYLQSIYAIAFSFNHLNEIDSASYYNKFGITEAIEMDNNSTSNYFVLNQGITHYLNKDFNTAIDSLSKSINFFKINEDKSSLAEAYFYIGESYAKNNNEAKALTFFKKLDTVFQEKQHLFPGIRKGYEYLIKYYKKENNLSNQLEYINKLIRLDSISHLNKMYLNKKIITEYDVPILVSEKERIIDVMKRKTSNFSRILIIISILVILLVIVLVVQYNKNKVYKKRFEETLNEVKLDEKNTVKSNTPVEINIPQNIIDSVSEGLREFEEKNKFISSKITLNSLAKELKTNTNYLSKIINHHKSTSFSNYLNTLRIEYIIKILKKDSVIRRYTIKAIAIEAGFNNSESFSKAFYKVKGIKPSYFLRKLEKVYEDN
ncbi:AraC family transcriptional regulator [Tenacibaculum sp.]|nr:AraC family transcriptional regulator [Tenacibaculum sp.]